VISPNTNKVYGRQDCRGEEQSCLFINLNHQDAPDLDEELELFALITMPFALRGHYKASIAYPHRSAKRTSSSEAERLHALPSPLAVCGRCARFGMTGRPRHDHDRRPGVDGFDLKARDALVIGGDLFQHLLRQHVGHQPEAISA